jgi:hypothetical protein
LVFLSLNAVSGSELAGVKRDIFIGKVFLTDYFLKKEVVKHVLENPAGVICMLIFGMCSLKPSDFFTYHQV